MNTNSTIQSLFLYFTINHIINHILIFTISSTLLIISLILISIHIFIYIHYLNFNTIYLYHLIITINLKFQSILINTMPYNNY